MAAVEVSRIVEVAIRTIRQVQLEIQRDIATDPEAAFSPQMIVAGEKPLLAVDQYAEKRAAILLATSLGLRKSKFLVLGEERLTVKKEAKDLTGETKLLALLDMVDGTDLLERGLSNWCSAIVFFDPQGEAGQKILAAFVGIHEDGVYYATKDLDRPRKYRFHIEDDEPRDVTLPCLIPKGKDIAEASICFYGQQVLPLLSVVDHAPFTKKLRNLASSHKHLKTRIYNLAGNPMMIRMIDGHTRIDAVFDVNGQAPHDVVAGAYIACKAGAVMASLDGTPIDLEASLLYPSDPSRRLFYVLASSETLRDELLQCLPAIPRADL